MALIIEATKQNDVCPLVAWFHNISIPQTVLCEQSSLNIPAKYFVCVCGVPVHMCITSPSSLGIEAI